MNTNTPSIAKKMFDFLSSLAESQEINEDKIVTYLDNNCRKEVMQHKFTTGYGVWKAVLVFKDTSVIHIEYKYDNEEFILKHGVWDGNYTESEQTTKRNLH